MGVFDYVNCALVPEGPDYVFQTKDTDEPYLNTVSITEQGRALLWDWSEKRHIDLNFHGVMGFYDFTDKGEWIQYEAVFKSGQCVEVASISDDGRVRVWPFTDDRQKTHAHG